MHIAEKVVIVQELQLSHFRKLSWIPIPAMGKVVSKFHGERHIRCRKKDTTSLHVNRLDLWRISLHLHGDLLLRVEDLRLLLRMTFASNF